jgi:hypothetical protein
MFLLLKIDFMLNTKEQTLEKNPVEFVMNIV